VNFLSEIDVTPKSVFSRMVCCISFVCEMVLLAAYSGILISFITNQQEAIRFDDLDGLL
jgi:hypothetical protein